MAEITVAADASTGGRLLSTTITETVTFVGVPDARAGWLLPRVYGSGMSWTLPPTPAGMRATAVTLTANWTRTGTEAVEFVGLANSWVEPFSADAWMPLAVQRAAPPLFAGLVSSPSETVVMVGTDAAVEWVSAGGIVQMLLSDQRVLSEPVIPPATDSHALMAKTSTLTVVYSPNSSKRRRSSTERRR